MLNESAAKSALIGIKGRIVIKMMKITLTGIFLGFFSISALASVGSARPNVVLMLADNLGFGDIGAYGGGEVLGTPTPSLDALAAEGLMLTQFFVEPGCTPSRAGLMTGRYSVRSGLNSIIVAGTPLVESRRVHHCRVIQAARVPHRHDGQMAPWPGGAKPADEPGF